MTKRSHAACRTGLLLGAMIVASLLARQSESAQQDQAKVAAGAQTYNEYCSTCHGDNLVNSGVTFDLRRLKVTERARFENSVLNGKNQMPPWNGVLSGKQIEALWIYIRANASK